MQAIDLSSNCRILKAMFLVDSHCHLDAPEFDADRDAVLARARAAGVRLQLVPAVRAADWPALAALAARNPDLVPAYGLHPMYLAEHRPDDIDALAGRLAAGGVLAIGECGLDHYVEGLDRDAQRKYFEAQVALARDHDLPLIVHARHAVDAVLASVRRVGRVRGIVHSYGGSAEQAVQLARAGFLVGIGGPITYERARRLHAMVRALPLSQLVVETDAPDQPLAAHRGQRNEPGRLPEVVAAIAALRGEDPAHIANTTARNVHELLRLPLPAALAAAA
jgi:TatD DNase family protein